LPTVARFELAAEQARRRRWQERVDNAGRFDTLAETLKRATHETLIWERAVN
jgi:hypothetical protein